MVGERQEVRPKGSQTGEPLCEHGAAEAEWLLLMALPALGLPTSTKELVLLSKSAPRKAAVGTLLRKRTAAANGWIAERLAMGHESTVSRLAKDESAQSPTLRKLERAVRAVGGS